MDPGYQPFAVPSTWKRYDTFYEISRMLRFAFGGTELLRDSTRLEVLQGNWERELRQQQATLAGDPGGHFLASIAGLHSLQRFGLAFPQWVADALLTAIESLPDSEVDEWSMYWLIHLGCNTCLDAWQCGRRDIAIEALCQLVKAVDDREIGVDAHGVVSELYHASESLGIAMPKAFTMKPAIRDSL